MKKYPIKSKIQHTHLKKYFYAPLGNNIFNEDVRIDLCLIKTNIQQTHLIL